VPFERSRMLAEIVGLVERLGILSRRAS